MKRNAMVKIYSMEPTLETYERSCDRHPPILPKSAAPTLMNLGPTNEEDEEKDLLLFANW